MPTPTREGYTFKGWNGKNKFNLEVDESTPSNTNLSNTSSRTFIPNTYVVGLAYNNYYHYKDSTYNFINNSLSITPNSIYLIPRSGYGVGYPFLANSNTKYTISFDTLERVDNYSARYSVLFYKEDGSYISNDFSSYSKIGHKTKTITTPSDTYYLVAVFSDETNSIVSAKNIQLEEGAVSTAYEPYYITSNTKVVQNQDHTLTAVWEKNSFVSDIKSLVTATASNTDWKVQTDTHNVYSNGVATSTAYTDYRYTGQNPNNYIDIGDTVLWRVIGVINEEYDSDGDGTVDTRGELVKIVRNGFLDTKAWTSGSYIGNSNDWSNSKLMKALNEIGESSFYSYRIPNDIKPYIVKARRHLLGMDSISDMSTIEIYNKERYTGSTYNGNPRYFDANVGFIYPSDIMYSLLTLESRESYNNTSIASESYLYDYVVGNNGVNYYWLMTPSDENERIFRLTSAASIASGVSYEYTGTSTAFVKPTIYLNGNVRVTGSGTSTDPYTILSNY